jgi:hypothetical protein
MTWLRHIRAELRDSGRVYCQLSLTDEDHTTKRFRGEFPGLSRQLGLAAPAEPDGRFPSGPVFVPRDVNPGGPSYSEAWRGFLARHRDNDCGLHGADVADANAATLATGTGAIRSRFLFPADAQARFPRPEWLAGRKFTADVTTVLGHGGPITLIEVGSFDPPLETTNGRNDSSLRREAAAATA